MQRFVDNFSRGHLAVAAVLWLALSGLTFVLVSRGLNGSERRPGRIAATTAATVLGPMTGAISRGGQRCCLAFSLSLLPWCGAALLTGAAAQFLPGKSRFLRSTRLVLWTGGLLVWFGGGLVSFGHALS